MKVIGEKRGLLAGSLTCEHCEGKTGVLYTIQKDNRTKDICTSCQSIMNMVSKNQGHLITKIWEHKMDKNWTNI